MSCGFYGYGKLEDELIHVFCSGAPDFEKAEELRNKILYSCPRED